MYQSDEYIPPDIKPTIFIFRHTGIWPPMPKTHLYNLSTVMWLLLIGIPFPLTIFVNLYYATTIQQIVDHFLISTTAMFCTLKAINIYWQQRNVRKVFELHATMLNKSNNKFDDVDEFNRIKRYNRLILRFFVFLYLTTWCTVVLQVIFGKPEKRMWPSTYNLPHETLKEPKLYLIVLIYQGLSNLILTLWCGLVDTFPVILILMLGGHIDRLCQRLRQLGKDFHDDVDDEETKLSPNDRYYRDLKECIEYYELCTRFAKHLERVVSGAFILQFGISGIVICLTVYELTAVNFEHAADFLFVSFYTSCMIAQIFFPSSFGSMLLDKSEKLTGAIYTSLWYERNGRCRSGYLIFAARTMKPITLFAGGLFMLSLPTFLRVCKGAYSMYAVLEQLS